MKIALISEKTVDADIASNLHKIKDHANHLGDKVDMICFGEGYLHGFNALSWSYEADKKLALTPESQAINSIKKLAKQTGVAIAFGYFEHDISSKAIHCSYKVIDEYGESIYNYRRVSIGWKEYKKTNNHYQEGKQFHTFKYKGKKIAIALCGDLWYKENIDQVNALDKDFVLWPLHIDYSIDKWINELDLYKKQTNKISTPVLMVNNISKTSFGGCYHFKKGEVIKALDMGQTGSLIVDC